MYNFKKYFTKLSYYVIIISSTLLIYNLKLKLFILITLVDFAELLTDFSKYELHCRPRQCRCIGQTPC